MDKEQLRNAVKSYENNDLSCDIWLMYSAAKAHLKLLDEIDSGKYYLSKSGVKGMVDIKEIF